MNNRFISSAWQGDCKGEVKLRFRPKPGIKQWKLFWHVNRWVCLFVCEAGVRLPLTHTHTCVNTHTPSLEQHVVHPESRARLMVARILLAWWYRLLVSAEDVGEKKKKHPVCSHTGSVAYNSNLMHQSLLAEQQSVSYCINCSAHMVITKKPHKANRKSPPTLISLFLPSFPTSDSPLPFSLALSFSSLPPPLSLSSLALWSRCCG